jgi:hypothetical protein
MLAAEAPAVMQTRFLGYPKAVDISLHLLPHEALALHVSREHAIVDVDSCPFPLVEPVSSFRNLTLP